MGNRSGTVLRYNFAATRSCKTATCVANAAEAVSPTSAITGAIRLAEVLRCRQLPTPQRAPATVPSPATGAARAPSQAPYGHCEASEPTESQEAAASSNTPVRPAETSILSKEEDSPSACGSSPLGKRRGGLIVAAQLVAVDQGVGYTRTGTQHV